MSLPARVIRGIASRAVRARDEARWHLARVSLQLRDALSPAPKLPPGSLGVFARRGLNRADFYLDMNRKHGPIFKVFWGSGDVAVFVIGFPLTRKLFAEHRDSLTPVNIDITAVVPKGFLRLMSGPDHQQYRRVYLEAIRADLADEREPSLRGVVREELDSLGREAPHGTRPGQMAAAMRRIATRQLLVLFFGDRPESNSELEAAFQRLGPEDVVSPLGPEQVAAYRSIRELVGRHIATVPTFTDGGESVIGRVVRSTGVTPPDETAIGNAIFLLEMGRHNVRGLFHWIVWYLANHPEVVAALRANAPPGPTGVSVAESVVLETLRLDQAEALNRRATREFVFEGYRIPKGSQVCVMLRESHQDAATFPNPASYCPHRFLTTEFSADQYAPFGVGAHQCVAGKLVIRLGALLVEELVHGFDWSVTGTGPRYFGKYLWQPSPNFGLKLWPRNAPNAPG